MCVSNTIIPVDRIYVGVVLISDQNEYILQKRDDKAGIVNPGLITPFGGSAKKDESLIGAAIREIEEELSLALVAESLKVLTYFLKTENDQSHTFMYFYYCMEKINVNTLILHEGKEISLFSIEDPIPPEQKLSIVCKDVIDEYKRNILWRP
jgi:8-oxo-dGTP pyrophosphatase MutT (NUDIX family)